MTTVTEDRRALVAEQEQLYAAAEKARENLEALDGRRWAGDRRVSLSDVLRAGVEWQWIRGELAEVRQRLAELHRQQAT